MDRNRVDPTSRGPGGAPGRALVSVVLIFLDEERFLGEAVASVYAQTYAAWELILVDDGSSDGSSERARSYAESDSERVRYLDHPGHGNHGQGAARNLGVNAARGEWIAFLDGDDVWLPNRLERGMALARAHQDADAVYGKTEYWHSWDPSRSASLDRVQQHYFAADRVLCPPDLLVRYLSLRAAYPCMGSLLVRRRAYLNVGGFEETFGRLGEDLVFFAKLTLRHAVYVSNECWDRYRQHSGSISAVASTHGSVGDAECRYVSWLGRYLETQGVRDPRLHRALGVARRRAERPPRHWRSRLERVVRRIVFWPYQY